MPIVRIPVDITWSADGGPGVNVWHAEVGAGIDDAEVETVLAALEGFYNGVANVVEASVEWSFAGLVTDVESGEQVNAPTFSVGGTGTGGFAPLATALCITWRSGTTSRTGIGRTFISPVKGTAVDEDGTPVESTLEDLNSAAQGLLNAMRIGFPGGGGLGVYSRQIGEFRGFSAYRIRDTFAVLRSRRD